MELKPSIFSDSCRGNSVSFFGHIAFRISVPLRGLDVGCAVRAPSPDHWKVKVLVAQCPTLCDPMDCSPPGSSVRGILQARILEWVAVSSSRGSSRPRD